jgi:hypothetical protein
MLITARSFPAPRYLLLRLLVTLTVTGTVRLLAEAAMAITVSLTTSRWSVGGAGLRHCAALAFHADLRSSLLHELKEA